MPIALSLALSSGLFLLTNGIPLSALVQNLSTGVNSFALLATPFFILAGALMIMVAIVSALQHCAL